MAKELGKLDPKLREKDPLTLSGRSEKAQATVYQKHMSLLSRKAMYRD